MTVTKAIARTGWTLLAIVLILLPTMALAQQPERGGESLGAALLRTVAALLFILGLFFLFVYLMKRFFPGVFVNTMPAAIKEGEGKKIKLLSTKQLGPKRYLHVVRVGSREFLIGAGDQGFARLGEWEADEESLPGAKTTEELSESS